MSKKTERDFSTIPLHDLGKVDDPTLDGPGIPDVPSDGTVGVVMEATE